MFKHFLYIFVCKRFELHMLGPQFTHRDCDFHKPKSTLYEDGSTQVSACSAN